MAIQRKFFAPTSTINNPDIDSFLAASGKEGFIERIVVSTTDTWNGHAEDAIKTRQFPCGGSGCRSSVGGVIASQRRVQLWLMTANSRVRGMAFGDENGPAVEPFLMGMVTLAVLTAAAEEQLVLCVVDNAHWLDPATADALPFCARRLGTDRIVMVFSTRDGAAAHRFEAQDLAEITLTGLAADAARALLDTQVRTTLAEEVTQHLISETRATRWHYSSCRRS